MLMHVGAPMLFNACYQAWPLVKAPLTAVSRRLAEPPLAATGKPGGTPSNQNGKLSTNEARQPRSFSRPRSGGSSLICCPCYAAIALGIRDHGMATLLACVGAGNLRAEQRGTLR